MTSASRPRILPLLVPLLAAVGLTAGCGGSSSGAPTSGVTGSGTLPASSSSPPAPGDATALVRRYYGAVDGGDYRAAWQLLAPSLRHRFGGFAGWRARRRVVDRVALSDARESGAGPHAAIVALRVEASGSDACGEEVERSFAARWKIAQRHRRLLATGFHLKQVGESKPARSPSACPAAPSTPSSPPTVRSSEPKQPPAGGPAPCPPGSPGCLRGPAG